MYIHGVAISQIILRTKSFLSKYQKSKKITDFDFQCGQILFSIIYFQIGIKSGFSIKLYFSTLSAFFEIAFS